MQDFLNYIPPNAQSYCKALKAQYEFKFILKKSRLTKLGDFRVSRASGQYSVSVNHDLNPYQFLITFIHELAHLKVAEEHPRSVKSHGREWKNAFKELLQPILKDDVFPEPIYTVLKKHMLNPKAAAGSDPRLWNALKTFDVSVESQQLISVADGTSFIFRNKQFTKLKKRRTRILCKAKGTNRLYLIPGVAEVETL
jgi:SprT protein